IALWLLMIPDPRMRQRCPTQSSVRYQLSRRWVAVNTTAFAMPNWGTNDTRENLPIPHGKSWMRRRCAGEARGATRCPTSYGVALGATVGLACVACLQGPVSDGVPHTRPMASTMLVTMVTLEPRAIWPAGHAS